MGQADDGVQRRSDLVAHVGEEHRLHPGRVLGARLCFRQLSGHSTALFTVHRQANRNRHRFDRLGQPQDLRFRRRPGQGQVEQADRLFVNRERVDDVVQRRGVSDRSAAVQ
jgi:hypothetical protein